MQLFDGTNVLIGVRMCVEGHPGQNRGKDFPSFLQCVFVWHSIQSIRVCVWPAPFVPSASFPRPQWQPSDFSSSPFIPPLSIQLLLYSSCSSCPLTFNPSLSPLLSFFSTRRLHASTVAIHLPRGLIISLGSLALFQFPKFLPCLLSLSVGIIAALSVPTLHPTESSCLTLFIFH